MSRLRQRLSGDGGHWRVVNASISGDTTGGGLARLPDALAEHRPRGGDHRARRQRRPARLSRQPASATIWPAWWTLARDAGCRVLLLGMRIPPNYGPRYTQAFADVFREVAETEHVPLVPFLLDNVALKAGPHAAGRHPSHGRRSGAASRHGVAASGAAVENPERRCHTRSIRADEPSICRRYSRHPGAEARPPLRPGAPGSDQRKRQSQRSAGLGDPFQSGAGGGRLRRPAAGRPPPAW